jgi:porphobilinogen synthase
MTLSSFPNTRLRRLRQSAQLRSLVQENQLNIRKLVLPLFIKEGKAIRRDITSMPGHFQMSPDVLAEEAKDLVKLGIKSVILFGIPGEKDGLGQDSYSDSGIIQQALKVLKKAAPELLVMTDLCMCEYTDHGHCGVMKVNNRDEMDVHNDDSLELLSKQAVSHAQAGADVIAPSANMDGMVGAIRQALDAAGFHHLPILSYAVKYASALYSPFRQAAEGAPQFGDRASYQMDVANSREALRECELDIKEGADMLMVKPAHTYLDVIYRVKQSFPQMPLCAYHTSGEYALIKAAAAKGWADERKVALEVLTAIHRAGADFIITYFCKDVVHWLKEA